MSRGSALPFRVRLARAEVIGEPFQPTCMLRMLRSGSGTERHCSDRRRTRQESQELQTKIRERTSRVQTAKVDPSRKSIVQCRGFQGFSGARRPRSGWIKVKSEQWKAANQYRAKLFEKPS